MGGGREGGGYREGRRELFEGMVEFLVTIYGAMCDERGRKEMNKWS